MIPARDFDPQKIMESGQCFRMTENEKDWFVTAHKKRLRLSLEGDAVRLWCSEEEFDLLWRGYFDLDTNYAAFRAAIPSDDGYLGAAARFGEGIRILRQDPWEMLVTFLISQRKNIPAIQKAVETLCVRYGEPFDADGETAHAFPAPQALARLSRKELDACSLGYRSPYVLAAARMAADGVLDFDALSHLDDNELLAALQTVPGVGPKVANCIALFGFHRLAGFPRDVWINRVIDEHYGGAFPLERYEGFAGVMQQYLFFYARAKGRSAKKSSGEPCCC